MIEFARILEHLRLDADALTAEEANYLLTLEKAAIQACENHIERKIFETDVPDGEYGMVINEQIEIGCLLLITHMYENRSAVSPVQLYDMPSGVEYHWQPYRSYAL